MNWIYIIGFFLAVFLIVYIGMAILQFSYKLFYKGKQNGDIYVFNVPLQYEIIKMFIILIITMIPLYVIYLNQEFLTKYAVLALLCYSIFAGFQLLQIYKNRNCEIRIDSKNKSIIMVNFNGKEEKFENIDKINFIMLDKPDAASSRDEKTNSGIILTLKNNDEVKIDFKIIKLQPYTFSIYKKCVEVFGKESINIEDQHLFFGNPLLFGKRNKDGI